MANSTLHQFVTKCKQSASYFMEKCCRIKHPALGVIPFKLFEYQRSALNDFRQNRFNVFKKCRQCGASTLTGIYALWVAMFFSNKKILIVSKRDDDAMEFLRENVKFVYDRLPGWMREIWQAPIKNEHELGFTNGSRIKSLTSSPDTLRSNASFLNIVDEAAFMPDMESMWAGGWSTLQHGGRCIVISTPNGMGNWYWDRWSDAETEDGLFNPILINWWDMDWVIEAIDPISLQKIRIAPTDGIRKCTTKADIIKYGPYWSPWLENELKGLQQRGESHLFKQEVLGEFVGSGGSVLNPAVLHNIERMVNTAPETMKLEEPVLWLNQSNGDREYLDFEGMESQEGLWVWAEPVVGKSAIFKNGRIIDPGKPGHIYSIGIDIATGENNDYSAIEVFDITTLEQVAEYMGHIQIPTLAKMADWIGRWYNNALICPERTGVGSPFIQDLKLLLYPNIWRQRKERAPKPGSKTTRGPSIIYGLHGFPTSGGETGKAFINKMLIQNISDVEGEGYSIRSSRLHRQLLIYIRHRSRQGMQTKKTGAQTGRGNHDDLVIAAGLSFIAAPNAIELDPVALLPASGKQLGFRPVIPGQAINKQDAQKKLMQNRSPQVLMPLTYNNMSRSGPTAAEELGNFTKQLVTKPKSVPIVSHRKRPIIR